MKCILLIVSNSSAFTYTNTSTNLCLVIHNPINTLFSLGRRQKWDETNFWIVFQNVNLLKIFHGFLKLDLVFRPRMIKGSFFQSFWIPSLAVHHLLLLDGCVGRWIQFQWPPIWTKNKFNVHLRWKTCISLARQHLLRVLNDLIYYRRTGAGRRWRIWSAPNTKLYICPAAISNAKTKLTGKHFFVYYNFLDYWAVIVSTVSSTHTFIYYSQKRSSDEVIEEKWVKQNIRSH